MAANSTERESEDEKLGMRHPSVTDFECLWASGELMHRHIVSENVMKH